MGECPYYVSYGVECPNLSVILYLRRTRRFRCPMPNVFIVVVILDIFPKMPRTRGLCCLLKGLSCPSKELFRPIIAHYMLLFVTLQVGWQPSALQKCPLGPIAASQLSVLGYMGGSWNMPPIFHLSPFIFVWI